MKKIVALLTVSLLMVVAIESSISDAKTNSYRTCVQLRKKFPNGIAKNSRAAKRTKATISKKQYQINILLDTNKNKIACEKGERPRRNTTTVATTIPRSSTTFPVTSPSTTIPIPGSFGSGTKFVGSNGVSPGRYLTITAGNCYWERLSGFSGTLDEILANDNAPGNHVIVDIKNGDSGFSSSRCGLWFPYTPKPPTTLTDGVWSVTDEISPGTWSATPSSSCYWARLSGFGGTLDEILANDNVTGSVIVEIQPGDVGFLSSRCGTWSKIA